MADSLIAAWPGRFCAAPDGGDVAQVATPDPLDDGVGGGCDVAIRGAGAAGFCMAKGTSGEGELRMAVSASSINWRCVGGADGALGAGGVGRGAGMELRETAGD